MTGGFSLKEEIQNAMRRIPSMDKLLSQTWIAEYESEIGRETVKAIISAILAEYRKKIQDKPDLAFDTDSIIREAKKRIAAKANPTLGRVVNATGVVLHTNLGRSLLADSAIKAVNDIAGSYNTLEYSPEEGQRGHGPPGGASAALRPGPFRGPGQVAVLAQE